MTTPYTYLIGWKSHNKFYYGRRTAKNCHPSDFWKSYFTSSKYVKEIFTKYGDPDVIQIRKIFSGDLLEKERIELCKKWEQRVLQKLNAAKNPKFINKSTGDAKFDSSGMVSVIDCNTGETVQITSEEFINQPDRYTGVLEGRLVVTEIKSGITTIVDTKEYHRNKHLYKHHAEGFIFVTLIKTSERVKITTSEFHSNRHLYKHHSEGIKVKDEIREKIRRSHTGKSKTEQHKKNISTALKGIERTPEHVENLNKARRPAFKAVIVNGIRFHSVNAAAAYFGVKHPAISNRLAGRKKLNDKFWEVRYA
jgi:hypothetical protein